MKRSNIVVLVIAVLVIIGVGAYLLSKPKNTTYSTPTSNTSTQTSQSSTTDSTAVAATITYSSSGFSPATTMVKAGDTVAIKNTSGIAVQFQSDPHPSHTDDSDLNVGVVNAGQTKTFVVTKTGSFGYHNHLDPSQTGKIVIQ